MLRRGPWRTFVGESVLLQQGYGARGLDGPFVDARPRGVVRVRGGT